MGAFFTNYQVRSNSAEEVINVVARLVKARAYVSPPKDGWVTVYDETSDDQDQRELQRLAKAVSKELSTSVFAFLDHDSDILAYFLFERGEIVDEYDSNPDYFEEADAETRKRCRGNAGAILKHCISGTRLEDIEKILHHPDEYGFAEEILVDLAPLLGMDEARLHLGFKYFTEEGAESLQDAENFRLVGRGVTESERADRQERIREAVAAAGPPAAKAPQAKDLYCLAIGMIIMARGPRALPAGFAAIPGINRQNILDQVRKKMDGSIKRMVKQCATPEWPSAETLLAAADKGPSELANLIATAAPQLLDEVTLAAMSDLEWLRAFVQAGANVNAANKHGQTPLMKAMAQPKIENLAYLLEAGADPNGKLPDGKTPLQFALQMKRMDVVDLLRQHGAKE